MTEQLEKELDEPVMLFGRESFQAILFGIFAALLQCWGYDSLDTAIIVSASSMVMFCALFFSRGSALLSVCIFLLSAFFEPVMFLPSFRVFVFAGLIIASRHLKNTPPPYMVVTLLWFLLLLFHLSTGIDHSILVWLPQSCSTPLLTMMIVEIMVVAISGLLVASPIANFFFGRACREVSDQSFFVHLVALPTVIATLCCFSLEQSLSFEQALSEPLKEVQSFALVFFVLLVLPSIIGLVMAICVKSSLDAVCKILDPEDTYSFSIQRTLPLLSIQNVPKKLHQVARRIKSTTRQIQDLSHEIAAKEQKIRQIESRFHNHLSRTQCAFLGINPNGEIIAAKGAVYEILKLAPELILTRDYSVLKTERIWNREIDKIIRWCFENIDQFLQGKVHKRFSLPVEEYYLEITVTLQHIDPSQDNRDTETDYKSGIFTILLRQLPDIRNLQRTILSPNRLEFVGIAASQLSNQIGQDLGVLTKSLTEATTKLNYLQDETSKIRDIRSLACEIAEILTHIESGSRTLVDELQQLSKHVLLKERQRERFNLTRILENSIPYMYNLLELERKNPVFCRNRSVDADSDEESDSVFIQAAGDEMTRLLVYLLALIKHLIPMTRNLEFSLDYEIITPEIARILVGAEPTKYARIVIRHTGQRVLTKTLEFAATDFEELGYYLNNSEAALTFLTYQTKRMGGFLSLQSSNTRGTEICLYIPVSPSKTEEFQRPLNNIKEPKTPTTTIGRVVVVGKDTEALPFIEEVLAERGYSATITEANELLGKLASPLTNSGSGFDVDSSEESKRSDTIELRPFNILLFNLDMSSAQTLELLDLLDSGNENIPKLFMMHSEND